MSSGMWSRAGRDRGEKCGPMSRSRTSNAFVTCPPLRHGRTRSGHPLGLPPADGVGGRRCPEQVRWGGRLLPTASQCAKVVLCLNPLKEEASMEQVSIIGIDLARIFHEGARFPVLACFSGVGAGVSGFVPEILPPVWRCRSVSGDFRRFRARSGVAGWVTGVGPTGLCWECGVIRVSAGRRPGGRGPARGRRRTGGSAPAWYCG